MKKIVVIKKPSKKERRRKKRNRLLLLLFSILLIMAGGGGLIYTWSHSRLTTPVSVVKPLLKKATPQLLIEQNFPDPFILKDNGSYYIYGTNANNSNVPYATSTDNKTYPLAGDALPNPPWFADGQSVTAPSVLQLGNQYILYSDLTAINDTGYEISAATADSPTGPFTPQSAPMLKATSDQKSDFFDPDILNADGALYLAYSTDDALGEDIWVQSLTTDGLHVTGTATRILDHTKIKNAVGKGTVNRVESPALVKAPDGTFVLFYSANDSSSDNYYTGYATSKAVTGPYTDQGALLTSGNLNWNAKGPGEVSVLTDGTQHQLIFSGWVGPHQGAIFQGTGGRHVFSQNFQWKDGHSPALS